MNGKSRPMGGSQTLATASSETLRQTPDENTDPRFSPNGGHPVGLVRGLDGKHYRSRPLRPGERADLIGYVHRLRHDRQLSVRQIVAHLADEHGVRVAVGSVAHYLTWTCDACSGEAKEPPEHLSAIADTAVGGTP